MKQILISIFIMALCLSCSKKDSANNKIINPNLNLASVSNGSCLKVDAIANQINSGFNFPAYDVTQDFQVLSSLSANQTYYYTHSSFDYSKYILSSFDFVSVVDQDDCKKIRVKTSSGQIVNYLITSFSPRSTTFHIQENSNEEFAEYFKKAFESRPMPYQYEVTWISETQLKIKTWFKSLDVLCDTTSYTKFVVTKLLSWNYSADTKIAIDINYYNTLNQVSTEPYTFGPEIFVDETGVASSTKVYLTHDQLSSIYSSQIKDQYRYCN